MISVIDRTLSTVKVTGNSDAVRAFISGLFSAGVNIVELSEEVFLSLDRRLPAGGKYILRLSRSIDAERYPEIHRFVAGGAAIGNVTMSEDYFVREGDPILTGTASPLLRPIRLCLIVDGDMPDPQPTFLALRDTFLGYIEFSPRSSVGMATTLAAEWVLGDGNSVVATLGGVGGYASLEELIGFLRAVRRRRPAADREVFSRLRELFAEVTGNSIGAGDSRFFLGTVCSCHAVKFKLDQLGYSVSAERLKALTVIVRAEARRLKRSLGDEDMIRIYKESI